MEFLLFVISAYLVLTAICYIGALLYPDHDETESKRHSRFKK